MSNAKAKTSDPRDGISLTNLIKAREKFEKKANADKSKARREIDEAVAECVRTGNSAEAVARLNAASPHTFFVKGRK